MIGTCSVIPTAVMMLSSENTRSSSRIWTMAEPKRRGRVRVRTCRRSEWDPRCGGSPWWLSRSGTGLRAIRIMSRQENGWSTAVKTGSVSRTMMATVPSRPSRRKSARPMPIRRAFARWCGKLVGQDGNEDQVVDPEHDLHDDERNKRDPGSGIGGESKEIGHGSHVVTAYRRAKHERTGRASSASLG